MARRLDFRCRVLVCRRDDAYIDGDLVRRSDLIEKEGAASGGLAGAILLEHNDKWGVQRARYDAGNHAPFER